jgi:hypothetical protein
MTRAINTKEPVGAASAAKGVELAANTIAAEAAPTGLMFGGFGA